MTKKVEPVHKQLNDYLRKQRQRSGLTQEDVMKYLGFKSPQYISNFERNICDPSLNVVCRLIKLYKVPKSKVLDIMTEDYRKYLREQLKQAK